MLAPLIAASVPGAVGATAGIAEALVLCAAAGLPAEASAMRRSTLPMASVMVLAMPFPKERCCLLAADGKLRTDTTTHTAASTCRPNFQGSRGQGKKGSIRKC